MLPEPPQTLPADSVSARFANPGCGTLLRALMCSRGGREGFFDLSAGRDRFGQRAIEFRLAANELPGGRAHVGLPVASGGIEGRCRIAQLPFDSRTLLLRCFMFSQNICKTCG